jgi:pimeloyl-ACP methyl ester carboxylesterase
MGHDMGRPTIILESGLGFPLIEWAWVQPALAQVTRVVAYDRAGIGWSERGPLPRDGQRIAHELHATLHAAGIDGPYVLVGHSAGGLYARRFAALYPAEVAGMVLIDPSHEDMLERSALQRRGQQSALQMSRLAPFLARLGILRFVDMTPQIAPGLPPKQHAQVRAFMASPGFWTALGAELGALEDMTNRQMREAAPLVEDLPLAVVSADDWSSIDPVMIELHKQLAALSSNGTHRILQGASHASIVTSQKQSQLTSTVILEVINAARTHPKPVMS